MSDPLGLLPDTGTDGTDPLGLLPNKNAAPEPSKPDTRTTGQKIAGAVGPYARPVLEGAGATAGAMFGAAGGPVGVAAGGAGGFLAGKYGSDLIDEYSGAKKPPTAGEQAMEFATKDAPNAAITGMAGPLIEGATSAIKGLGKWGAAKVLGGGLDSEGAARAAAMNKAGIDATPAEITQRPSHAIVESELQKNIGSADIARKKALLEMKQAQDYATKIEQQTFGGKGDVTTAGQTALSSAKGRYGAFQKVATKLYDSIPVSPTEPIETHTLSNVATEYKEELGKLQGSAIKRVLKIAQESEEEVQSALVGPKGEKLPGTKEPTYTWQQLRDDQSTILKMAKASSDPNRRRILYDLHGAINDDIFAYGEKVGDPEIKKTLDMANKFYKQGTETIPGVKDFREAKIASAVMKSENPEDLAAKYMTAKPNQSDLTRLQKVIGPKGYRAVKQAWFSDMISQGEDQSFNAARYVTRYNNYINGGNLKTMLTPKEKEGADALYEVSKIMVNTEKLASNPSGTGRIAINDLYRYVHHPIVSIATQAGSKKFAEKYFNDPDFQKLFIFGLKQAGDSKLAQQAAAMLRASMTGTMGAAIGTAGQ